MLDGKTKVSDRFESRLDEYRQRVEMYIDGVVPGADVIPEQLHQAMRYAVLNGGKRIRPLLVYAAGECLGVPVEQLDPPAAAIEMIHAFSLVHDDLPAMDDDDLRRGKPTVHRKFNESTAILAGDALLPLAFSAISDSGAISDREKVALASLIATASGSLGMTGGQAIDLAAEGQALSAEELERMHNLKTGALIHASVMSAASLARGLDAGIGDDAMAAMDRFGRKVGLAFQIRDDLLDVEGSTETLGKMAGADELHDKATWPSLFGLEEARRYCDELLAYAHASVERFGDDAGPLHWLADYIVARAN